MYVCVLDDLDAKLTLAITRQVSREVHALPKATLGVDSEACCRILFGSRPAQHRLEGFRLLEGHGVGSVVKPAVAAARTPRDHD
eukprot:CAMPEP_0117612480 /NCGR_PEP_ID=MMETSP0784-20121206/82970_1 /TAXON_ID=39447 /ORGANISM="" /LENGTH=83 /DNA_ID=CAMNT_0005416035 /DNA_START=225 /DNA_END=476 /DNA_ORIENTATION=+